MADASVCKLAENLVEKPGETWIAEIPLKAGAIGLAGAVMPNLTHNRSRDSGQRAGSGHPVHDSNAGSVYRERYWYQREFDTVDAFLQVAKEAGLKPATLAIAWVMRQPAVTAPNIGASRAEQLADTLAAVEIRLENDLVAKLDTLTREFRRGDVMR